MRKKRRKDHQAAAHKLKMMERGLQKLRLTSSSRSEGCGGRMMGSPLAMTRSYCDTFSSTSSSVPPMSAPVIGGGGNLMRGVSGSAFSLSSISELEGCWEKSGF